jgi:epoxyqueuosine reductase
MKPKKMPENSDPSILPQESSVTATVSRRELSARTKAFAAQSGFELNGIARLPDSGLAPRSAAYDAWIAKGFHGPLDYMLQTQDARSSTRSRFPWAKSVLALGAFYDGASRGEQGRDLIAHVARYARSRDYHLIFTRRLKVLSNALISGGICSRAHYYVDTGPVLERAWAEAAGIGWIGKNTCLINTRLGSFFLLAEILIDAELEPDEPAAFHCGTCRRCLDACPTQAFAAPGVLDAQRCLVTWNIELRGQTPVELWPEQGEWVAGCDVCQTVCPYNSPRRVPPADAELGATQPWHNMTLSQTIVMTKEIFDAAFPASALRRSGIKGLRLGAITVAGNVKAEDCRDALSQCLTDVDEDIRKRAAWALKLLPAS